MRLTGVTYRRLDRWVNEELISPSRRASSGKGSRRLFKFSDVVEVRTLKSLTASGVRLGELVKCVQELRKKQGEAGPIHLSAVRLVTDGRHVFRYVAEQDKLEQMDEFGQFAFAFGLGSEIKSLLEEAEKLDRRSRYNWHAREQAIRTPKKRKSV